MIPRILASRQFELEFLIAYSPFVGMDEVGCGAFTGPVAVGTYAITGSEGEAPSGPVGPKPLSARKREKLAPQVRFWATASTVVWASNEEIDRFGIIAGLRLAGMRAPARIEERVGAPALILLDDSHDWLTLPEDLLASLERPEIPDVTLGEVMTQVKADAQCTLVAAASVIAKVARGEHMTKLEGPGYGWASNKGYSSSQHMAGFKALGSSFAYRCSWSLPKI